MSVEHEEMRIFSPHADLRSVQAEFAAALRAASAPCGRLAIYHNNRLANFRKALALAYPIVEALVGEEYFAQLAKRYQAVRPSRHGDLQHVSDGFPEFLRAHFATLESTLGTAGRYRYIADVAVLEEAFQQSLIAPDAPMLEPAALAAYAAQQWPALRFEWHPAARILQLQWPVFDLWREHRQRRIEHMERRTIAPAAQWLQVSRVFDSDGYPLSEVRELDPAAGRFLAALAHGETLGAATDAALCESADFDLGAALSRSFSSGLFRALVHERPEGGDS